MAVQLSGKAADLYPVAPDKRQIWVRLLTPPPFISLAQLAEQRIFNPWVMGSSPVGDTRACPPFLQSWWQSGKTLDSRTDGIIWGCRQVVRHQTLTLTRVGYRRPTVGSNPTTPAISKK